jgi:hypothetical protein
MNIATLFQMIAWLNLMFDVVEIDRPYMLGREDDHVLNAYEHHFALGISAFLFGEVMLDAIAPQQPVPDIILC